MGAIPEAFASFAKFYPKLKRIAEMEAKERDISGQGKVSSFTLSDGSTAQLDVHLLNAVINDKEQCKPEVRATAWIVVVRRRASCVVRRASFVVRRSSSSCVVVTASSVYGRRASSSLSSGTVRTSSSW